MAGAGREGARAILRRWYELLLAHQDNLGALMTAEQGKPLAETKGEIAYAASFIEWFAEEGKRTHGDDKAGPALAAGCVMVIEPAEQTPFSALAPCELAQRGRVSVRRRNRPLACCRRGARGQIRT